MLVDAKTALCNFHTTSITETTDTEILEALRYKIKDPGRESFPTERAAGSQNQRNPEGYQSVQKGFMRERSWMKIRYNWVFKTEAFENDKKRLTALETRLKR